jgi:hypothetical protein
MSDPTDDESATGLGAGTGSASGSDPDFAVDRENTAGGRQDAEAAAANEDAVNDDAAEEESEEDAAVRQAAEEQAAYRADLDENLRDGLDPATRNEIAAGGLTEGL